MRFSPPRWRPAKTAAGAQRSAQRCLRDETVVAATGIERGETGYPGAATSGIVKDSPGFIQAMLTKMKTGIAGGRRRAEMAVAW